MAAFIDRVVLHLRAGDGGHGCSSIHREKFVPLGGPDGGNGGNGGDVTLVVDPSVHTLLDFHFRPHQKAGNGQPGAGNNRSGAEGGDLILAVPNGTVVLDEHGNELADLTGEGSRFVAAAGGRGGLGNAALASRHRKAPGFALKGEPGEEHDLVLELKTRGRRRPGRLPVGGQVVVDRRDQRGPAEDRRLPVHHARAQPGRGQRRRHRVHRRRRARPHPRRGPGQGPRASTSCATSNAARCCCTCSTAPPSIPAAIRSATWTRSRPSSASTRARSATCSNGPG